jgi:hypothetical protein
MSGHGSHHITVLVTHLQIPFCPAKREQTLISYYWCEHHSVCLGWFGPMVEASRAIFWRFCLATSALGNRHCSGLVYQWRKPCIVHQMEFNLCPDWHAWQMKWSRDYVLTCSYMRVLTD